MKKFIGKTKDDALNKAAAELNVPEEYILSVASLLFIGC